MVKLVFTCGDINGIGPEISVKTFSKIIHSKNRLVYFTCPPNVFTKALEITNVDLPYKIIKNSDAAAPGVVNLIKIGSGKISPGKITKASGVISYRSLDSAIKLVKSKLADAVITAPISKSAIVKAGFNFPGHTEYLASEAGMKKFLMVFLSNKLICSLATIHIAHKNVSGLLSGKLLKDKISIFISSLKEDLGILKPRIAVLGLNPHAGESGKFGDEESKIIIPVLNELKSVGISGPFVPDAFFGTHSYKKFDAVIGMYHDQVLIPFKMMNFNKGVNFTAGLPFIRTSPDHGTAFDIAWKNLADESSMLQAVKWAEKIYKNRQR